MYPLTALDGMRGHLERDVLSSGLRYVHAEHEADAGIFPPDVRLAFPQLDVGVPELQDPGTVDSVRRDERVRKTDCFKRVQIARRYILTLLSCCSLAPAGSQGLWCRG